MYDIIQLKEEGMMGVAMNMIPKSIKDYQFTQAERANVKRDAYIEGKYRYWLTRVWDDQLPRMMWILLNPSIADNSTDDPTVKKCMGFAKGLGYGSIEIVNLYAYIATDPKELIDIINNNKKIEGFKELTGKKAAIGPYNDQHIKTAAQRADVIILGWGNNASRSKPCKDVIERLSDNELKCIEINKSRQPKHPLFKRFLSIKDKESLLTYIV